MDIKVDQHTVIVFDLDDTLYNELDYLKSAYKAIALFLEPNDWKHLYGKMFSMYRCKVNVFEFLSGKYKTEIHSLIQMYRNHEPDIQLFDVVLDVLEAITNKSGKIGIITDGRTTTQKAKIKNLGLLKYVDAVVISDEIGSEKPTVANFKAIENALPGNSYYYIADNWDKDFIAPNALGWKSIALLDNGMNIHFESHTCAHHRNMPNEMIIGFKDLIVI